jgi:NitT/TauT family transport system substrate-binding protein
MKTLTLIGLMILLVGCSPLPSGGSEAPTEVRLLLPFRPDVQFAPFYVAQEKGYFAERGLDVRFEHMVENEALALVGADEAPFAVVSGEQVLLARAQGLPVVYVMAWWQGYPVAIAVPAESDIQSLEDLAGKKIGIPGLYGASYIGYRALMEAAGLPEDAATLDAIGYSQVEALLAGQEDAVVVYANNEPVQLEAQGLPVRVFKVADYVPLASNGLVTHERLARDEPGLVRRMVAAVLQGMQDALADPEGAYDISTKYVEGLDQADREVLLRVLTLSMEFWQGERLGYSDPQAWQNMHDVLLNMGLLERQLDVEEAFTNEFLPEQ